MDALKKNRNAQNLLSAVVSFMLRSGVSRSELSELFCECLDACLAEGELPPPASSRVSPGDDFVAAAAIKIWHRDARFLTSDARPKPLRLRGPTESIEALVRTQYSAAVARTAVSNLMSAGLIRPTGRSRYLPSREVATISQLHPLMIEHVSKSILRLVETVGRNTSANRRDFKLIERFARVPDLDVSEARAFADFTHRQGLAYLRAVDDWLEARRTGVPAEKKGRRRRASIGAGVHLYAYMGNDSDDLASLDLVERAAGSFRRSSSGARSGSKRAAAPCKTSGVAA